MRLLLLLSLLVVTAACTQTGSPVTEQKLREVEARAEAAEKKLSAMEQKLDPKPSPAPATAQAQAPAPASAPAPVIRTIPAGTAIVVRTTSLISTKTAQANEPFVAHLEQPLMANGMVIAPKGAAVTGVVTQTDPGGRVKGRASLTVALTAVTDAGGRTHRIATSVHSQVAKSGVKNDAVKTGVASGIGAAIGAIAGGGKGAAIGAGAGAGGGAAVVLSTRGPAAEIAPESVLRFSLARPLQVQ